MADGRISWFPVARMKIVREDRTWKGTCGRTGETYLVWSAEQPRPCVPGCHKHFAGYTAMYFMRDDFVVIPFGMTGFVTFLRDFYGAVRSELTSRRIRKVLRAHREDVDG